MGKWQKELDQVLKQSEKNKKILEESAAYYQKVVESAQTFTAAYTKAAPQFGKTLATLLDLAEECARAAGELTVLEDELEAAQKSNDKSAVKKIEAKMKPFIATFESVKKEGLKVAEETNKADDDLMKLVEAVKAAAG